MICHFSGLVLFISFLWHHQVQAFAPACSGAVVISLPSSTTRLCAKSGTKKKKPKDGTICTNRNARRNYDVVATFDAGISLLGTEVKSIRGGKINIRDGFVTVSPNGRSCTLYNVHIAKCGTTAEYFQHEETRPRVLLLKKEESRRLKQEVDRKGMTVVPLKAYFSDKNWVKIQIGICKGKNVRDKRNAIKDRESKRDIDKMVKNFRIE